MSGGACAEELRRVGAREALLDTWGWRTGGAPLGAWAVCRGRSWGGAPRKDHERCAGERAGRHASGRSCGGALEGAGAAR
jgi:hypothetical protein